jgi:hypothetical protein
MNIDNGNPIDEANNNETSSLGPDNKGSSGSQICSEEDGTENAVVHTIDATVNMDERTSTPNYGSPDPRDPAGGPGLDAPDLRNFSLQQQYQVQGG